MNKGNTSFYIQLGYYGEPQDNYPILDRAMYLSFEYVVKKAVVESVYAEKRDLNKNSITFDYSLDNFVVGDTNISIIFPKNSEIEKDGIFKRVRTLEYIINGALAPGERTKTIEYYTQVPLNKRLTYDWEVNVIWILIGFVIGAFLKNIIKIPNMIRDKIKK